MSQEPVFEQVCQALLERLREEMAPSVLGMADDIKLTYPNSEADYRFGVYFYSQDEVRPYGAPPSVRLDDSERRNPDRSLALRFLLYANRKVPFDSMSALDEAVLIEAAIRAVHSMAPLEVAGQKIKVEFQELSYSEKASLWQTLSTPLQPAVYVSLEPVAIPSARIRRAAPVREVEITTRRKGGE